MKKLLILPLLAIAACGIDSNPWEYLDNYSAKAKQEMCFAYDYGPTGVGKLFNELAGEEPAGSIDELEEYLATKC